MMVASRLLLRLDDGSLIGDASRFGLGPEGTAMRITVDQAFGMDRAGSPELHRLERVVASLRDGGPSNTAGLPFPDPSLKRQRVDSVAPAALPQAAEPDFYPKCQAMFQKLTKHLGPEGKNIFWNPVTKAVAPDYPKIIKAPMSMSDVEYKLKIRGFGTPFDFYNDVSLIWSNCKVYNGIISPLGKMGAAYGAYFESLWQASGWANDARGRRTTAGVAAPRFEADAYGAAPQQPKASGARGGSVSGAPGRSGGVARPGAARPVEAPISDERRMQIANLLGELGCDDTRQSEMEAALALIPPNFTQLDEGGEVELDFESIDNDTMKKLDAFMRRLNGGAASPTAASGNPSVRLDADTSEDDAGGAGSDSD